VWDTLPTVIGDVLVTVSASIWTLPGLWALDPDIGGTVVWIFRRRTSTTATPSRSSPPSVRQYYDQARGTAELRRPKACTGQRVPPSATRHSGSWTGTGDGAPHVLTSAE
jgi:hypothetical protein